MRGIVPVGRPRPGRERLAAQREPRLGARDLAEPMRVVVRTGPLELVEAPAHGVDVDLLLEVPVRGQDVHARGPLLRGDVEEPAVDDGALPRPVLLLDLELTDRELDQQRRVPGELTSSRPLLPRGGRRGRPEPCAPS